MVAKMMHQTKLMILLSLNAVAVIIVGVMIFSAINLNGGIELKVVNARSDITNESLEEFGLIAPSVEELQAPQVAVNVGGHTTTVPGNVSGNNSGSYVSNSSNASSNGSSGGTVSGGELWGNKNITMYQTADFDICVNSNLSGLGDMYWLSDNPAVISKFYNTARTWLGYDVGHCRYPVIVGTGTTTITAGTYDGKYYDKITVTVIAPPVEQWKRDVLNLVNQERAKQGLNALAWGGVCATAADVRVREIMTSYSHTRPDGSSLATACPEMSKVGGKLGENLHAGNAAVSPETVVASWMASPDHRANILNPEFKYVTIGFIFDPSSQHKTYWSQYFSTS